MSREEQTRKMLETQYLKYGGEDGFRKEMRRRVLNRKTVGGGFRDNTALAKRAAKERWKKHKTQKEMDNGAQDESTAI